MLGGLNLQTKWGDEIHEIENWGRRMQLYLVFFVVTVATFTFDMHTLAIIVLTNLSRFSFLIY